MIAGAVAIQLRRGPRDRTRRVEAGGRTAECRRYGLDPAALAAALQGDDGQGRAKTPGAAGGSSSLWTVALAIFVWLAMGAQRQPVEANLPWMAILIAASLAILVAGGLTLWRRTRFS